MLSSLLRGQHTIINNIDNNKRRGGGSRWRRLGGNGAGEMVGLGEVVGEVDRGLEEAAEEHWVIGDGCYH
jgi:hypothetical protein